MLYAKMLNMTTEENPNFDHRNGTLLLDVPKIKTFMGMIFVSSWKLRNKSLYKALEVPACTTQTPEKQNICAFLCFVSLAISVKCLYKHTRKRWNLTNPCRKALLANFAFLLCTMTLVVQLGRNPAFPRLWLAGASGRVTINENSDREPDFWLLDLNPEGKMVAVGVAIWTVWNGTLQLVCWRYLRENFLNESLSFLQGWKVKQQQVDALAQRRTFLYCSFRMLHLTTRWYGDPDLKDLRIHRQGDLLVDSEANCVQKVKIVAESTKNPKKSTERRIHSCFSSEWNTCKHVFFCSYFLPDNSRITKIMVPSLLILLLIMAFGLVVVLYR